MAEKYHPGTTRFAVPAKGYFQYHVLPPSAEYRIRIEMKALEQTFRVGGETIHAVLLRQTSKLRWNAFLWGAGLQAANSFARREAAEKWLAGFLERYFPTLRFEFPSLFPDRAPAAGGPQPPQWRPPAGRKL